jgi:predicted RNA binding protein YcfA (HicA-like mRNA interferase family)
LPQTSKLLERVLSGRSDANINFNELVGLLQNLQFQERIKGSHHIFNRLGVEEILNLQPKGSKAKPYQVRQVRQLILKYRLGEDL